jgi:NurA-like 5'-3' nuclease
LGLLYLFFLHEWKTGEFFPSFEITKTSGSFIWYFKKIKKIKNKLKINK